MSQSNSHEFRVLLTNGKVVHFTMHELRSLIYGRNVVALLIVFMISVAASDPTLFPSLPEFRSRVFYWGLGIVLYLLLLRWWALMLNLTWHRLFEFPIPLIIATFPMVVGLTIFCSYLPSIFGDLVPARGHAVTWVTLLKNSVLAHVLETAALVWFLPFFRGRRAEFAPGKDDPSAQATPERAAPNQFVVLNGRSVPVEDIRSARSAEHYLIVTTRLKKIELRARMKDFLEQVTDDQGVQTHRSFWVAADEAEELRGDVVKTLSGNDIPVSRGRLPMVREWFERQGKAH